MAFSRGAVEPLNSWIALSTTNAPPAITSTLSRSTRRVAIRIDGTPTDIEGHLITIAGWSRVGTRRHPPPTGPRLRYRPRACRLLPAPTPSAPCGHRESGQPEQPAWNRLSMRDDLPRQAGRPGQGIPVPDGGRPARPLGETLRGVPRGCRGDGRSRVSNDSSFVLGCLPRSLTLTRRTLRVPTGSVRSGSCDRV